MAMDSSHIYCNQLIIPFVVTTISTTVPPSPALEKIPCELLRPREHNLGRRIVKNIEDLQKHLTTAAFRQNILF